MNCLWCIAKQQHYDQSPIQPAEYHVVSGCLDMHVHYTMVCEGHRVEIEDDYHKNDLYCSQCYQKVADMLVEPR